MNVTQKRKIASRLLLAVFLPMLFIVSLHVHSSQASSEVACVECANHMPHAGHLTSGQDCVDNCVLCQILHTPVLPALAVVLVINIHLLYALRLDGCQSLLQRAEGIRLSRAPPFI